MVIVRSVNVLLANVLTDAMPPHKIHLLLLQMRRAMRLVKRLVLLHRHLVIFLSPVNHRIIHLNARAEFRSMQLE